MTSEDQTEPGSAGFSAEEQSSARRRTPGGSSRALRWIVVLTGVVAISLWLVVASTLHFHSSNYRDELAQTLVETNESIAGFIVSWSGDVDRILRFVAGQDEVAAAVTDVVATGGSDTAGTAAITEILRTAMSAESGVLVAAPDGTILFHSAGPGPFTSDSVLEGHVTGEGGPGLAVMPAEATVSGEPGSLPSVARAWVPVGDPVDPAGWLGVEVDVVPIVRLMRSVTGSTESREVYFFDRDGELLTPIRFEPQLVEIGLLEPGESSIGLPILDPGRNLISRPGALPADAGLTRMATSAVRGESGVDVEGYRDYRGVPVVGAWLWVEELGVGVATEIDRSEAFAALHRTSMIWSVGASVLTVLMVVLSTVFAITDRRLRRSSEELFDLTQHLDEEVRVRTADLEDSRVRLQAEATARAELVAAVSHELRTPLTSVVGFARLLKEQDHALDPSLRVFVQLLLQEGEEMSDLVDDLLTSVRISTASLEVEVTKVDLASEVDATLAAWSPEEQGRVTIDTEPALAQCDPLRFRQILRNLVSNAIRHGGPQVRVETRCDGAEALLVVADDGPPLDAEIVDRMFEMYSRRSTTEGLAPSIGIGLTLCRRLAVAMGGSMSFARNGDWNTFTLRLPGEVAAEAEVAA